MKSVEKFLGFLEKISSEPGAPEDGIGKNHLHITSPLASLRSMEFWPAKKQLTDICFAPQVGPGGCSFPAGQVPMACPAGERKLAGLDSLRAAARCSASLGAASGSVVSAEGGE